MGWRRSGTGTVDLNSIPTDLIERLEVVTGGASAVYGSDAVAGVVNIILKDDFEGISIEYMNGGYDEGDGDTKMASLTFGGNFADGKVMQLLTSELMSKAQLWLVTELHTPVEIYFIMVTIMEVHTVLHMTHS